MASGGSGGETVEVRGASQKALGVLKWDYMWELVKGSNESGVVISEFSR